MTTQRRSTQQRAEIDAVLADTATFISAQDFHTVLKARGSTIGIATVYRALQSSAVDGEADAIRSESGEMLYRRCADRAHHHHLICRNCGRTEEIQAGGVERWIRDAARTFNFVEVEHRLEFFGLCADCAAAR